MFIKLPHGFSHGVERIGTERIAFVDRHAREMAERGIAGAEIVDGQAHPESGNGVEHAQRAGRIFDETALGEFHGQELRRQLMAGQEAGNPRIETHIADIVGAPEAGRILMDVTPTRLADAVRDFLAAPPARAPTRLYAEQFDWQSTTQGQIALFREICERRSKGQPDGHAA